MAGHGAPVAQWAMLGAFGRINERASIAALVATWPLGGAMMDADLDHHGVCISGHGGIGERGVGFDHCLERIVVCRQGVDAVGEESGAVQKPPRIRINNEERYIASIEQNSVGALTADLGQL